MPFDFGDDPARPRPASGMIGEVCVELPDIVGRAAERSMYPIRSCRTRLAGRRIAYLMRSVSRNS